MKIHQVGAEMFCAERLAWRS